VGKTTRLLERARALQAAGVEVVVGWADARGRRSPARMLDGLERVPPREFGSHGLTVPEMDVDAVLRRRPAVCVVDDVAHANVPTSRHLRRHEDAEALLDGGISVLAALDVESIAGLAPLARTAAGRTARETVPDAFVRDADEVTCVDVGVDELLARYRAGDVVPAERVREALASLPPPEGLRALREMALRETAEALSRSAADAARGAAGSAQQVSGRVLVCLASASPRAGAMLRRAARIAGRLNTEWFAVHVGASPDDRSPEAERALLESSALARALGGEISLLRDGDPVAAVLDFARSHRVAHVIVGRSGRGALRRTLRRTFVDRLLAEAHDLDVHVVAADLPEDAG
jgi:two-component system, OmpR family, sensor histidine kinase KdpD